MNEELEKKERKLSLRDFLPFIVMICTFYTIAIVLFLVLGSLFYLINFTIIGTSVALGMGLWPVFIYKNNTIIFVTSHHLI